jgi:hypothetical protein
MAALCDTLLWCCIVILYSKGCTTALSWLNAVVCPVAHACAAAGKSRGSVAVSPKGTIQLRYTWGAPHGGSGFDDFSIDDKGRLRLCTIATVANESVEYCQVYNKQRG